MKPTLPCSERRSRTDPAWDAWLKRVTDHGGLIISIDGIQPDEGNQTIYLVRDVLPGRVLCAENLCVCDTAALKALVRPVVELQVPILGVFSDCPTVADRAPSTLPLSRLAPGE